MKKKFQKLSLTHVEITKIFFLFFPNVVIATSSTPRVNIFHFFFIPIKVFNAQREMATLIINISRSAEPTSLYTVAIPIVVTIWWLSLAERRLETLVNNVVRNVNFIVTYAHFSKSLSIYLIYDLFVYYSPCCGV